MKENNISVKELSKEYLRIEKNKLARLLREQKRMIENQLEYYTEL
jgi:phage antirepressor YoqD-like protein